MTAQDAPLWIPILVSASVALFAAGVGGVMTDVGPWYQALKKPWWNPPNWLFGPIWTTIYVLVAASAVVVWRNAQTEADQMMIMGLFAVNVVLGILWNVFFFKLRRPDLAMFEIVLFWASILALIVSFWRISTVSSFLLLPYLTWVGIASFLNLTIVRLNTSFKLAT